MLKLLSEINRSKLMLPYAVVVLLVAVFAFFPTSRNGIISQDTGYVLVYYSIFSILIAACCLHQKISRQRAIFSIGMMVYLSIITVIAGYTLNEGVAFARVVVAVMPLFILMFDFDTKLKLRWLVPILEILTIVIFIWNVCLFFSVQSLVDFTVDNFSSFNSYTVATQIASRRPVFTFGIYSYGAYMYMLLFLIWRSIYALTGFHKRRYYVYMLLFAVYEVFLGSSTALAMLLVMIVLLVRSLEKPATRIFLILSVVLIALVMALLYFPNAEGGVVDWKRLIFGNESNGFISRYFTGLFEENFRVLRDTHYLGIGFTTPSHYQISYTDSGYIVNFTVGGLLYLLVNYGLLWMAFRKNTGKQALILFFLYLLFEFGMPGMSYPKLMMLNVLMFVFYSAIRNETRDSSEEQAGGDLIEQH